jgi:hypothetical protein
MAKGHAKFGENIAFFYLVLPLECSATLASRGIVAHPAADAVWTLERGGWSEAEASALVARLQTAVRTQRLPRRPVGDEFCQDITYNYYINPHPADGSPSLQKHFPVNGHLKP